MANRLPPVYRRFAHEQPRLVRAYERLGEACLTEGPLDPRSAALVKIGIAVGARLEGAMHSHVRKALEAGATPDEVRHAVRLGLTTVGFPTMMAALSWANDVLGAEPGSRRPRRREPARRGAAPTPRS
jgi:alkylhydroperoxidase/carboxymuconolactone decarboxylase family protein YurZ